MQLERKEKFWFLLICIAAIAFGLWLFNPFQFYFLNDDLVHIPLSKDGVWFQRKSFRPVCDLSIRIDYLLWGKNSVGYHFTNLVLHVINTFLVYVFSKQFLKKYAEDRQAQVKGVAAAILFFVYAFHSETVFWILGRSASLGLMFFLSALILYLNKQRSVAVFFLSLVFYSIGLMTYESVWIFPLFVIAFTYFDVRLYEAKIRTEAVYVATVLLLFGVYLLMRYLTIDEVVGNYEADHFKNFNIIAISSNLFRLALRTFMPPIHHVVSFLIAAGLLIAAIIVMIFSSWKRLRQKSFLALLVVLLFLSFIPYLSLGVDTHRVEGERFLYMPSCIACLLIASMLFLFARKFHNQMILFSLLLVYQLWFLYKAHCYYETAGAVSKVTYQTIHTLARKKRLFVDSLPESNNGALIFRLGFEEGLKWLNQDSSIDSVFILSVSKSESNWIIDYPVIYQNPSGKTTIDHVLVRDMKGDQQYKLQSIKATTFNHLTDAWLTFTKDGLKVTR